MIGVTSAPTSSTLLANVQERRRGLVSVQIVALLVAFVIWFAVGLAAYSLASEQSPGSSLPEVLAWLLRLPSDGARLAELPGPEFVMAILGVILTLVVTALVADFSAADNDAEVGLVTFEDLLAIVVSLGIFLLALLGLGGFLTGSWWLAVAGIGGCLFCSGLGATTNPSSPWRRHRVERLRAEVTELDILLAELPAVGFRGRDVRAAKRWRNYALYGGAVMAGLVVWVPLSRVFLDDSPELLVPLAAILEQ